MTYETDFENIQILKEQLYASDKQHKYTETATDMCIDKQCIQKIRYIDTKTHIKKIQEKKSKLQKKLLGLRKMYLYARSDMFDKTIQTLFENIEKLTKEEEILDITKPFQPENPLPPKENPLPPKEIEQPQKKTIEQTEDNKQKKQKVKEFLFKTYSQCESQKRSEPTYMSKKDLIDHIQKYYPTLLTNLPKSIQQMKKSDICKLIFS